MKKLKLAFVWDWENLWAQMITWKDGLAAAIRILSEEWDVKVYSLGEDVVFRHDYFPITLKPTSEQLAETILKEKPDAILVWGDFTRPTIPLIGSRGIPMAICLAGGNVTNYIAHFDLIFVESKSYKDRLEAEGRNVIQAFGTNTELFKPIKQPKIWDVIFPACFTMWKRHGLLVKTLAGKKGLACGWMRKKGRDTYCWQVCQDNGLTILPHVSSYVMPYLYNASKTCVITSTAIGGSQRTVLESMACNIPVVVMEDSDKTREYVEASGIGEVSLREPENIIRAIDKSMDKEVNSRKWILNNYSEYIYAEKLKNGILSIL